MRAAVTVVVLCAVLCCNGCIMAGATVAAIGAIVAVKMKPPAQAAEPAGNPGSGLSRESAANLARAGLVVVVDAGTGTKSELTWQEGMGLAAAAQPGNFNGGFSTARIFRGGRMITAAVPGAGNSVPDLPLRAGDVVELRR